MSWRLPVALGFLLVAAGSPAAAGPEKTAEDAAIEAHNRTVEAEDQVVCKRIRETGSRLKRRVCRTERQWDQVTEDSQRNMQDYQRDSNAVPGES